MEFLTETMRWVEELASAGRLAEASPEARERLARELADRLEARFFAAVMQELALRQKDGEWRRLLDYGGQYLPIWLAWNLPNYREFRAEVCLRAKRELTGL
jgi:hypothetical protein